MPHSLIEMADYMEACAQIARNGAECYPRRRDLRFNADMTTEIAQRLRASADMLLEAVRMPCPPSRDALMKHYMLCAVRADVPESRAEFIVELLKVAAREHPAHQLLDRAIDAMTKLHSAAQPIEDDPDLPARIEAAPFRKFVDEHARLLYDRAHLPVTPG